MVGWVDGWLVSEVVGQSVRQQASEENKSEK